MGGQRQSRWCSQFCPQKRERGDSGADQPHQPHHQGTGGGAGRGLRSGPGFAQESNPAGLADARKAQLPVGRLRLHSGEARGQYPVATKESMHSLSSVFAFGLLLLPTGVGVAQPATQFNVKNYGAAGDGSHSDTDAINKAITTASGSGGGTVLIPAGAYLSGTIQLQNNVTLWIDAGATILGTPNLVDYRWPEGGREWDGSIILANGVHNVALMGRGMIDGQNLMNPRGEEHIRGPHAVLFNNSKDIVVRDITIRDAGNYSLI